MLKNMDKLFGKLKLTEEMTPTIIILAINLNGITIMMVTPL